MHSLKYYLLVIFHRIGSGPVKSVLKNIMSYAYQVLEFRTETITINGVSFKMIRDNMCSNTFLADEDSEYNRLYPLKPGDIVIDGGAYSGDYAIYAAIKVGPAGRVIAFEPDPYNRIRLKRNIALNRIKTITVIEKGLYDRTDTLYFDLQTISSMIIPDRDNTMHSFTKIAVTSLDSEYKRLNLKRIDFIKMDIEGAEIEAIQGCAEIMKKFDVKFAIASYHMVQGAKTRLFLEKYFLSHQYKAVTYSGKQEVTYAQKQISNTIKVQYNGTL